MFHPTHAVLTTHTTTAGFQVKLECDCKTSAVHSGIEKKDRNDNDETKVWIKLRLF